MDSKDKSFKGVEKITFYSGLLILAVLAGYLIFGIFQKKSEPPQLEISTIYLPNTSYYKFKVIVKNTGGETAEAVNLTLDLYRQGKITESGTVTLSFVPVHSKNVAYIAFPKERNKSVSLEVSSVTYVIP